MTTVTNTSH